MIDFIEANISNDNNNEVTLQLIELLKSTSLTKTNNYSIQKDTDLMTIVLRAKDELHFVEMFVRVIFAINPYDYQNPNLCPYLVLLDNSLNSSSSQSYLNQLLNRSKDLSKGVNLQMAIISYTYLHQLIISNDHVGYAKKNKKRRIIYDSDDENENSVTKLNVMGMMNKLENSIKKNKDNPDYFYQIMHIVFTLAIVIGQHQLQHQDISMKVTIDGLKSSLKLLIDDFSSKQIDRYLRDFIIWILSGKGPETSQLSNLVIPLELFKFVVSKNSNAQRDDLLIDTVKSYNLVIEDRLKRKIMTNNQCHLALSRSFIMIKSLLPFKLTMRILGTSYISTFSRAEFRLQALKELSEYIINSTEEPDVEISKFILKQIYDVLMLDGTESLRMKSLSILKSIINITKIDKETYRIILFKLRDKSAKVRNECLKMIKGIAISDICDVLSRDDLIMSAKYLIAIKHIVPIDTENIDDKEFLQNLIEACLSSTENRDDVIYHELKIESLAEIPINMIKNVISTI